MKILHIVESLNRGAVENWLVRMYLFATKNNIKLDWTFYCVIEARGSIEKLALANGAKVIYSPVPLSETFAFCKALRNTVKVGGYSHVHCHHDLMSAIYLIALFGLKLNKIVHVHNMDEVISVGNKFKADLIRPIFRRICWYYSDKIIGISQHTLDRFLLYKKRREGQDIVHYYGVDPQKFFTTKVNKPLFKKSIGIPEDSKIFLFCSRIDKAKNPLFALEVLYELIKIRKDVVGIFVGSGSLENELKERAQLFNLGKSFMFLGWSDSAAEIMLNSDLFILPHVEYPREGLGLVVVEAQLAKLPILVSKGISQDAILPGSKHFILSLSTAPVKWAKKACDLLNSVELINDVNMRFTKSPFNLDYALKDLLNIYEGRR